ncbi:hypothetical protein BTUL_0145g00150 [Botrytis tulipae]|uniref:Uncharacterized protein n=1 Tax=Botrytis tulipae TaxID=87230 RepID=A0A4Z1EHV2_9HELO|nr:hypothetical protein BTUL_0145g00150 [Botrytis tulipae]
MANENIKQSTLSQQGKSASETPPSFLHAKFLLPKTSNRGENSRPFFPIVLTKPFDHQPEHFACFAPKNQDCPGWVFDSKVVDKTACLQMIIESRIGRRNWFMKWYNKVFLLMLLELDIFQ